jgi:hypothetical protein
MFYKAKVAVCSEIRTKPINAMWAPLRILERRTWRYVKLPLGVGRLINLHPSRQIFEKSSYISFREDPSSEGPICSTRTDRRTEGQNDERTDTTDMRKLTVAFRNFANAPKNISYG